MHEQESVGRFLASLLAEYDMSVDKFCRRSRLREHEVRLILRDILTVTPAVAEKPGRVFYSPGFWLVRQAMHELRMLSRNA
ncbi:XRE family transcriptional regulator [Pantoea stewartii]|uniref:XRE family transcriptional regulator n=1 Tax=Pantoea stewartii TaxID=66269 RepID=UPI0005436700|nr:XRE family transcriptional regulator [Pantoea stewartii]KHD99233.1 XRE family transcriptional regulator [Pantoea stewartii]KHN57956.1 XRE family transcriptional regulator [Pantoea stewartii]